MLFIIVVIFLTLFATGLTWYIEKTLIGTVQTNGHALIMALGTNSSTTTLVEAFITNVWLYIPVLALVVLSVWVYQAAQKRGRTE